jgi:hypothetical protein
VRDRTFGCWISTAYIPYNPSNDQLSREGWRFVKCYHRFGTADMWEKDGEFCFTLPDRSGIFTMPAMKALLKSEWRPGTDEDQVWLDSL